MYDENGTTIKVVDTDEGQALEVGTLVTITDTNGETSEPFPVVVSVPMAEVSGVLLFRDKAATAAAENRQPYDGDYHLTHPTLRAAAPADQD